jgi:hypothetical protein
MQLIGGDKGAKAQQRQQLAALAKQNAETDQALAAGKKRRGSQMLDFAQRSLSGDGQATLG